MGIILLLLLFIASPAFASRSFDGVDDKANVDVAAVTARPLTVCSTFKYTSDTGSNEGIFYTGDKDVDNTDRSIMVAQLGTAGNPARVHEQAGGAGFVADSGNSVDTASAWNYACVQFIGATDRRVQLNNGTEATNTGSVTPLYANYDRMTIGTIADSVPSGFAAATICETGIWNVQLTALEKRAVQNGINIRRVNPVGLKGYWPMWGIHSPEIDSTRQKNSLTLTGTTRAFHCARTPATR